MSRFIDNVEEFAAFFVQLWFTERAEGKPKLLKRYSKRRFWAWRAISANAGDTFLEDLMRLSRDENVLVLQQLAWNPNLPDFLRVSLLERVDSGVFPNVIASNIKYALTGDG